MLLIESGVVVQLVWVCLPGDHYGLALHIILLLRLFRMKRVFLLIKVASPQLHQSSSCVLHHGCPHFQLISLSNTNTELHGLSDSERCNALNSCLFHF